MATTMVPYAVAPRLQQELVARLRAERERLLRSTSRLAEAQRALAEAQAEESDAGGDAGDVASDLIEQAVDLTLQEAERARLAAVEDALRRVARGEYGICETCGDPIATERLYALPWATQCIRCASRPRRGP